MIELDLDESMIGLEGKISVVEVEKGHIKRFAEAIGDANKLYVDEEYAKSTPYGGLIAPPTFPVALDAGGGELPLDLDYRRMLHGEQEFIYYRPISPGDRLYTQIKVSDLYEKKGKSGSMQFLVLDTEMKDPEGNMVAISRMNIIYRAKS